MFSGLLGSSLLILKPNPLVLALEKYSCFRTLPNFPDVRTSDAESCFVSSVSVCVGGCVCDVGGWGKW